MKKIFGLLTSLCLAASLLAGCGGTPSSTASTGGASSGSGSTSTVNTGGEGVTKIQLPSYRAGTDEPAKFFLAQVDRFNEKYAGQYEIEAVYSGSSEEHNERVKQLGLQNELPVVFQFSEFSYAEKNFFKPGVLYDMAEWFKNEDFAKVFLPDGLSFVTQPDGAIYAVPLAIIRPTGMYYNTQGYTPSKMIRDMTWEEFIADMAAQNAVYGFNTAEQAWVLNLTTVGIMGTQPGGVEILEGGLVERLNDFNGDAWKNTFTTLKELYEAAGWEDGLGKAYPDLENAFINNLVSVMPNGQWVITGLSIENESWGENYDNTKISGDLFPGNVAIANPAVYDWYVSGTASEDEIALAKAYLEFISSQDELEAMAIAEGGSIPMTTPSQNFLDTIAGNKVMSEFAAAPTEDTVYVPYLHEVTTVGTMDAFEANLPAFLNGQISVDDFCQALTDAANE